MKIRIGDLEIEIIVDAYYIILASSYIVFSGFFIKTGYNLLYDIIFLIKITERELDFLQLLPPSISTNYHPRLDHQCYQFSGYLFMRFKKCPNFATTFP